MNTMTSTPDITRYLALVEELDEESAKIQEFLKPYVLDFYDFLAEEVSEEGEDPSGKFLNLVAARLGFSFPHYLLSVFDYTPSLFTFQGYEISEKGEFFLMENTRALEGRGFLPIPKGFVDNSEKWKKEILSEAGISV